MVAALSLDGRGGRGVVLVLVPVRVQPPLDALHVQHAAVGAGSAIGAWRGVLVVHRSQPPSVVPPPTRCGGPGCAVLEGRAEAAVRAARPGNLYGRLGRDEGPPIDTTTKPAGR